MLQAVRVKLLWVLAAALCVGAVTLSQQLAAQQVIGAQLRILDSAGLVRATKVVVDSGTVKISLDEAGLVKGECVATNLDGLAAERRIPVSPNAQCFFEKLSIGSWQVKVPGDVRWRAQIYE
jgi:hypothetical protein